MWAIIRKEIKSYFNSPVAYLFIGVSIFTLSFFYIKYNLGELSSNYSDVLKNTGYFLLFIIPMLTMRTIAEEKKTGTIILLVTSPNSLISIVTGKFLAAYVVYFCMMLITLIHFVIIILFGTPDISRLFCSYFGLLLFGGALISVGIFSSAITDNQIISATISFSIFIVLWICSIIGELTGGWIAGVLDWVSLLPKYQIFTKGIFSLNAVIYFFSISLFFLALSVTVIKIKLCKKQIFKEWKSICMLLIGIMLINITVGLFFNVKYDMTSNKLYTIGNDTKLTLNSLKEDVYIFGVFDPQKANPYDEVIEMLKEYEEYSHIKVMYIDHDKTPNYSRLIDPLNTFKVNKMEYIVRCGQKFKKVSYHDIFKTKFSEKTSQSYIISSKAEESFTNAIYYVSSEHTKSVYFLQGHNERDFKEEYNIVEEFLLRNNYGVKAINLSEHKKMPSDTGVLFVPGPKKDILPFEKDIIINYLNNGGDAVFLFDLSTENTLYPQLEEIMNLFGISINYYKSKEIDVGGNLSDDYGYIMPNVLQNKINSLIKPESFRMIIPDSKSIKITNRNPDFTTVIPLLSSSDTTVRGKEGYEQEEEVENSENFAVLIEYRKGVKCSKVLIAGDSSFMTDNGMELYGQYSENGMTFFLNCLNNIISKKDSINIPYRVYNVENLRLYTYEANMIKIYLLVILPLIIVGFGIFVQIRRKNL